MPVLAVVVGTAVVIVVSVVVIAVVAFALAVRWRRTSSVDSFRRHIDALGPAARRTTVDQVQIHSDREAGDDDAARGDDGPPGRRGDDRA